MNCNHLELDVPAGDESRNLDTWIDRHPWVTREGIDANGGRVGHYPIDGKAEPVVSLPILGLTEDGWSEGENGYVLWRANNAPFNLPGGTQRSSIYTSGARRGWVGKDAVVNLEKAEAILIVDFPMDVLAFWSMIPRNRRGLEVVLCATASISDVPREELRSMLHGKEFGVLTRVDDWPGWTSLN